MAPKRKLLPEEKDESEEAEYISIRKIMRKVWTDDIKPDLQKTFYGLLSEFMSNSPGSLQGSVLRASNPSSSFAPSQYQLHFENELLKILYTDNKFSIKVSLRDSTAKERITSGPLSSVKIEVVVLPGDFGFEEQKSHIQYFDDNIVRPRVGRRSLMVGSQKITLRGGVGTFRDIAFTDNSRWDRTGKFRLGARALLDDCSDVRVQEVISEAFTVKDNRVQATEKRHPPLLDDEVWRLERIKKGGTYHNKLLAREIKTVEDFLKFSVTDYSCKLKEILGEKNLEAVIQHARESVPDQKHYLYTIEEENTIIVFNSILEVVGACLSGHGYQPLNCLTDDQKKSLEKLKMLAYSNRHDMVEIENPPPIDFLQESLRRGNAFVPVSALRIHECPYMDEGLNLREGLLEVPSFHGKQIHPNQDRPGKYPEGITVCQMDPQCSNPMSCSGNDSHHRDHIPYSYSFCGSTSSSIPRVPLGQLDTLASDLKFYEDSFHDAEQTFSSGHELHPILQTYSCPSNNNQINETVYAEVTSYGAGFNMTDRRKKIALRKWGSLVIILKFKISTKKRFAAKRSRMKPGANWVKVKAVFRLGISPYYPFKLARWISDLADDHPFSSPEWFGSTHHHVSDTSLTG